MWVNTDYATIYYTYNKKKFMLKAEENKEYMKTLRSRIDAI